MATYVRLCGQVAACFMIVALCAGCGVMQEGGAGTPTLVSTPAPTLPPTDDVGEIVRRWEAAYKATDSYDATLNIHVQLDLVPVKADGSYWMIPSELRGVIPKSIEEIREAVPNEHFRYRVVLHYPQGDAVAVYDGKRSYRHFSWSKEIYRPMGEEVYKPGEYWDDEYWELVENTLHGLTGLGPRESIDYKFLSRQELEGHRVVELEVIDNSSNDTNIKNDHVYLDEANFLPYRVLHYINRGKPFLDRYDFVAFEVTTRELTINPSIDPADYSLTLPKDPIWVYDELLPGGVYTSSKQVAQLVEFQFFESQAGSGDEYIYTEYIVEKDGKQSRVLKTYYKKVDLIQGSYLPEELDMGAGIVPAKVVGTKAEIDINGVPGKLNFQPNGEFHSLLITRDGTNILIKAHPFDDAKEEAIELARSLQPVPKTP
jgi:hypothetical protein